MRHILTADLEDWFHVCGAEKDLPVSRWDELESQLPETTRRILDLLDAHDARATFFVLGYVAQRFPDTVAEVAARGHEIGSHGFAHRRVYELDPKQFAEDLRASVRAIENACGVTPKTFRAPEWSIRPSCDWAFEVLAAEGFERDSSVVPLTWLGSRSFPSEPYRIETPSGPIDEIPLSTVRAFHERLPFSGGLPFRIHPEWIVDRILRENGPRILYIHPSDFEDELPAARMPLNRRVVQRFRRKCVEPRLRRLLRTFEFVPLDQFFDEVPEQAEAAEDLPADLRKALRASRWNSIPWWFVAPGLVAAGVGAALGPLSLLIPPGLLGAGYLYHGYRVLASRKKRRTTFGQDDPNGGLDLADGPLSVSLPDEAQAS